MRQYVLYYSVGGPDSTKEMASDLNKWIKKGWSVKSVTNVYTGSSGYNIVVIEERENINLELKNE